jgi:hypothetical protein
MNEGSVYCTALLSLLHTMDLANSVYPMRSVIRCKVKIQLLQAAYAQGVVPEPINESLLKEIAATWFRSDSYDALVRPCRSKQEAAAIADQIAGEIAATYRTIVEQQENALVQRLNSLL